MSQTGDEEETSSPGRPNSWWAQQREASSRDGYSAEFRGVPVPKAGPQRVRPEDTIGDYDLCWCGEPADHSWPGKESGRKHPRKASTVSAAKQEKIEDPRIERKHLRAYDPDLADVVMMAVNDYGTRYSFKNNSIMLYPRDGSEPYVVHARNPSRQVKQAQRWFAIHVYDEALDKTRQAAKRKQEEVDVHAAAAALAETIGGPEHEPPKARPVAKKAAPRPVKQAAPRPENVEKVPTTAPAQAEPQPEPFLEERSDEEWFPHIIAKTGEESRHWLVNRERTRWKCRECRDILTDVRSLGGHTRMKHLDTSDLYGAEAVAKKLTSRRANAAVGALQEVVDVLAKVPGLHFPTPPEQPDLEARVDRLTKALADVTAERDELKTKLDLIREATGL